MENYIKHMSKQTGHSYCKKDYDWKKEQKINWPVFFILGLLLLYILRWPVFFIVFLLFN